MPKMKTRKAVAARFKVTGKGKLMRQRPGRRHILTKKAQKRKRKLRKAVAVDSGQTKMYARLMGFVGDRKNHLKLTADAVMSAMAFNYRHRKERKRDFRSLWITRISVGAKINGISYNKLMSGLKKAGCSLNRKMLSEMAIRDPDSFREVASKAKQALVA